MPRKRQFKSGGHELSDPLRQVITDLRALNSLGEGTEVRFNGHRDFYMAMDALVRAKQANIAQNVNNEN